MGMSIPSVPVLVKIFASLGFIGSVIGILAGFGIIIGSFVFSDVLTQYAEKVPALNVLAHNLGAPLIVMGVCMIVMALWALWVNVALWKGKSWARMIVVILCGFNVVSQAGQVVFLNSSIINSVLPAILFLAIALYLLLSKDVKTAFSTEAARVGQKRNFIIAVSVLVIVTGVVTASIYYFANSVTTVIQNEVPQSDPAQAVRIITTTDDTGVHILTSDPQSTSTTPVQ
jgi:hypothetical protein